MNIFIENMYSLRGWETTLHAYIKLGVLGMSGVISTQHTVDSFQRVCYISETGVTE